MLRGFFPPSFLFLYQMLKIVALDSLEVMVFVTFRWEDTLQLRFGFGILHNLTIFFVLFTLRLWLQSSMKYQSPSVVVRKDEEKHNQ